MECGEQCVAEAGITMMPELCADNWGTMSTQVEVSSFIRKKTGDGVGICYQHVRVTYVVIRLEVVFCKTWRFKTEKRTNLHRDAVTLTMYFLSYCTHISQVVISGLGLKIMWKYIPNLHVTYHIAGKFGGEWPICTIEGFHVTSQMIT